MKEQAIKALAPFILAKRRCCYFDDFAHEGANRTGKNAVRVKERRS
jgi:hypothetical protein